MEFSKMPRFVEEKNEEIPGPGYYDLRGSSSQMKLKAALQRSLVTQEALRSRLVLIQNARKKEKATATATRREADLLIQSLRASSSAAESKVAEKQKDIDVALNQMSQLKTIHEITVAKCEQLKREREAMSREHEASLGELESQWEERVRSTLHTHTTHLDDIQRQLVAQMQTKENALKKRHDVALEKEVRAREKLEAQVREVNELLKTVRAKADADRQSSEEKTARVMAEKENALAIERSRSALAIQEALRKEKDKHDAAVSQMHKAATEQLRRVQASGSVVADKAMCDVQKLTERHDAMINDHKKELACVRETADRNVRRISEQSKEDRAKMLAALRELQEKSISAGERSAKLVLNARQKHVEEVQHLQRENERLSAAFAELAAQKRRVEVESSSRANDVDVASAKQSVLETRIARCEAQLEEKKRALKIAEAARKTACDALERASEGTFDAQRALKEKTREMETEMRASTKVEIERARRRFDAERETLELESVAREKKSKARESELRQIINESAHAMELAAKQQSTLADTVRAKEKELLALRKEVKHIREAREIAEVELKKHRGLAEAAEVARIAAEKLREQDAAETTVAVAKARASVAKRVVSLLVCATRVRRARAERDEALASARASEERRVVVEGELEILSCTNKNLEITCAATRERLEQETSKLENLQFRHAKRNEEMSTLSQVAEVTADKLVETSEKLKTVEHDLAERIALHRVEFEKVTLLFEKERDDFEAEIVSLNARIEIESERAAEAVSAVAKERDDANARASELADKVDVLSATNRRLAGDISQAVDRIAATSAEREEALTAASRAEDLRQQAVAEAKDAMEEIATLRLTLCDAENAADVDVMEVLARCRKAEQRRADIEAEVEILRIEACEQTEVAKAAASALVVAKKERDALEEQARRQVSEFEGKFAKAVATQVKLREEIDLRDSETAKLRSLHEAELKEAEQQYEQLAERLQREAVAFESQQDAAKSNAKTALEDANVAFKKKLARVESLRESERKEAKQAYDDLTERLARARETLEAEQKAARLSASELEKSNATYRSQLVEVKRQHETVIEDSKRCQDELKEQLDLAKREIDAQRALTDEAKRELAETNLVFGEKLSEVEKLHDESVATARRTILGLEETVASKANGAQEEASLTAKKMQQMRTAHDKETRAREARHEGEMRRQEAALERRLSRVVGERVDQAIQQQRQTHDETLKAMKANFQEQSRKLAATLRSTHEKQLKTILDSKQVTWDDEKQKLIDQLNRVMLDKAMLEKSCGDRNSMEEKLHSVIEAFRTVQTSLRSSDAPIDAEGQLKFLRKQLKRLQNENGLLSGHHNMQQRIHYVQDLKNQNADLSTTVKRLQSKVGILQRKLEVATEVMENSIVKPSHEKKLAALAVPMSRKENVSEQRQVEVCAHRVIRRAKVNRKRGTSASRKKAVAKKKIGGGRSSTTKKKTRKRTALGTIL